MRNLSLMILFCTFCLAACAVPVIDEDIVAAPQNESNVLVVSNSPVTDDSVLAHFRPQRSR